MDKFSSCMRDMENGALTGWVCEEENDEGETSGES
jgi:hypothetical protein